MKQIVVRVALPNEQKQLEALQWRASFGIPGDREALLADPEVISVSKDPHAEGCYRSCGFQALGTTQTRFGTALLMYKPL